MKVNVYVVNVEDTWKAGLTIEPSVDWMYWFGGNSVEGLRRGWEHTASNREGLRRGAKLGKAYAEQGWLWKEALPLGQACRVVELWQRDAALKGGRQRSLKGTEEALMLLHAFIEEACSEAPAAAGGSGWRIGKRRKGSAQAGESLWSSAERWERAEGERRKREMERAGAGGEREEVRAGTGGERETVRAGVVGGERGGRRTGMRSEQPGVVRAGLESEREEVRAGVGGERGVVVERAISDAEMREIAAGAKLAAELLQGRALLIGEAHALLDGASRPGAVVSWSGAIQLTALLGQVRLCAAVAAGEGGRAGKRRCLRCGSGEAQMRRTACLACGRVCAYCEACLTMGRSRECELLIIGNYDSPLCREKHGFISGNAPSAAQRLVHWKLSPAQTAAATEALRFVEEPNISAQTKKQKRKMKLGDESIRSFLLWAVTGAGKTEMIFPLVESVLLRGGRALIATPRRDVVIELDPRIRKAFPNASVVTLYGGSEQRWEQGQITLSTTHQLLRFHECFDLVIIDEIDAFPYHGDPMLHYAADKSCLPGAARLLLSATPPLPLQRAARRGSLPHARVPVRYHRHPLPVPRLLRTVTVKQMLESRKLPAALLAALRKSIQRGAQIFVFVQRIAQTEQMAALLCSKLQFAAVDATSSQDPERAEKVQSFRTTNIRILVTTTILERGVTIPRSDVYIMDADGRLFDEASLVQMAGRAGRSADDPNGNVYFCSSERNQSQIRAVRHIQAMNRIARRNGYLLPALKKGGSTR